MINTTQINALVMQRFGQLIANQRLAHAYLFVGPQDSGKTQTALGLAQLVNCEQGSENPCGECSSCRKIASGNHPDVYVIGSDDKESIKIEEIRFLLSRVHLVAYEATAKVFIIRNIELMTLEAANALLKVLEEPSPHTLMILTTSVPENNLDTIKSRCHIVKFFPSSVNRLSGILAGDGLEEYDAHFLAVYSEGCLGKSRKLLKEDFIIRRRKILDEMLINRYNDNFLKELAGDPQEGAQALQLLLSFFRDVLLLKNGIPKSQLLHQERSKELEKFAGRPVEQLGLIVQQIVQTKKLIDDKLNAKMSLSLLREHLWAN